MTAHEIAADPNFRSTAAGILLDKPTWTDTLRRLAHWNTGDFDTLSPAVQEAFKLIYGPGRCPKQWGRWTVIE